MFLKKKKKLPEISLCIPVHNTERHIGRCLDSIQKQSFTDFEVVLINDLSTGKDKDGRSLKKILRSFKRNTGISVTYIEHASNVPLLETRRELVYFSRGKYILMVDSDDFLGENALKTLYDSAQKTGADITCGQERIYKIQDEQIIITEKRYAAHREGFLTGRSILDSWLIEKTSSAFLWAKLVKRELYLKAFDSIPYMATSLAVDTPIYFFLAYHAESYNAVNDVVYYYLFNEGITSDKKVTDLETWKRECTVASNYALLLTFEGSLTEEEKEAVRKMSRHFMHSAILRLRNRVIPELYDQARALLCEYWGENYVKAIEEIIDEK